jgi:hypothetical protein
MGNFVGHCAADKKGQAFAVSVPIFSRIVQIVRPPGADFLDETGMLNDEGRRNNDGIAALCLLKN